MKDREGVLDLFAVRCDSSRLVHLERTRSGKYRSQPDLNHQADYEDELKALLNAGISK